MEGGQDRLCFFGSNVGLAEKMECSLHTFFFFCVCVCVRVFFFFFFLFYPLRVTVGVLAGAFRVQVSPCCRLQQSQLCRV